MLREVTGGTTVTDFWVYTRVLLPPWGTWKQFHLNSLILQLRENKGEPSKPYRERTSASDFKKPRQKSIKGVMKNLERTAGTVTSRTSSLPSQGRTPHDVPARRQPGHAGVFTRCLREELARGKDLLCGETCWAL